MYPRISRKAGKARPIVIGNRRTRKVIDMLIALLE
jgi:hypothetical protein